MDRKLFFSLGAIFSLALFLRFLYFPHNVYFGFDQARDAFASQEIFQGNFKIVGPPTSGNLFHHGVLYYYIFGPIYSFFNGNPEAVSFFLRVFNALGIFLVFLITKILFNSRTAILAALLFAFSYEQTQFSIYLNHPSLSVISVLIFYLGLTLWIFEKINWGLILALFGLGLSIQFEFVELQLIPVFILFLLFFRKNLPSIKNPKNLMIGSMAFILPVSTYLIYEIKNSFYTISNLPIFFSTSGGVEGIQLNPLKFGFFINRFLEDNIFFLFPVSAIVGVVFLVVFIKYVLKKSLQKKMIFLFLWFFGGFLIYFITNDDAYFYNTGTSISLLIFAAFMLWQIYQESKLLMLLFLIIVLVSNFYLITKNNPLGPNQKLNPQIGLFLSDEKKVVDFIYQEAQGEEFSANALTMPFNINTTWSYLFQWYGQRKYGYLPIWGGDAADGYYGNLKIITARTSLPQKRFLIIEPKEGIPPYMATQFLDSEESFARTIEKKRIGHLEVWVQQGKGVK